MKRILAVSLAALLFSPLPTLRAAEFKADTAVKDASGKFIHEAVWRYLFTHAVEQVGQPVPHDPNCVKNLRSTPKPATKKK
ncbi:MAG: hypothetical protein HZA91_17030 [Verrucomicrobia bacterium]|nr:hypothetical protein [Verrucomicrobiota bacterium]